MLVGLSVSFCVRDIAEGVVDPDQVAYIIGGIDPVKDRDDKSRIGVAEGVASIVEKYNNGIWRNCPNAASVFYQLWDQGRILCSRFQQEYTGKESSLLGVAQGWWLQCEQVGRVEEYFGEPDWFWGGDRVELGQPLVGTYLRGKKVTFATGDAAFLDGSLHWLCESTESPDGLCGYDLEVDPACDECIYCGLPEERK